MSRFLGLALLLLAPPAAAQVSALEARTCEPRGVTIERPDEARDRREEAERYRGNAQNVSRQGDHLILKLEAGATVELVDCPYGDTARSYLYDRFDEAGPFYVVRKSGREDFSYVLVNKSSGRLHEAYASPIWSTDKVRFVTVACSLSPPRGALTIVAPSGDGLATEAEFPLPCEEQTCSARWDFQSWVSVSCTPHDSSGKKGAEFVLMRGNDKAWRKFGR